MSHNDKLYNENRQKIKRLEGEVLTLLEASMPEGGQLEALKSVTRNTIWQWFFSSYGESEELKVNK